MQNPFTTTFSKNPENSYVYTEQTNVILENFMYESPSESVYKVTGVRGSGKTVILAKVEEELRGEDNVRSGWLVFDVSPARDMLAQIAAMLAKAGFGRKPAKGKSLSVSASVLGTGGGIGLSSDRDDAFFDIGVEIEEMLKSVRKKGKKILLGVDEVSKTAEMVQFASEYGKWLRAGYPVYLVCTGLYENIMEVSNVKNLTFFRRATTVKTEPLNAVRMAETYRRLLGIELAEAREMAKLTKGYAYAFQELGSLYFRKAKTDGLSDLMPGLKEELFAYSYEKIWEELTEADRFLVKLLTGKAEYKREEVLALMGERAGNYSMYRDRLLKRGILESRQAYVSFALPFFAEYIKEYCA
ncbi:MAG: hypothetical protein K6G18_06565 [Treponema sp.]|nr:hypothetical protein [Treponema sp.]